jgi:hypothetical protein
MRYAGVCLGMLLAAAPARADTKVLRFTQSTALPVAWQQLPDRLATSIAAVIDGHPSDESLVTLDCDGEDACLEDVADKLGASELVFGTIQAGDDSQTKLVRITRFTRGGTRASRAFTIELIEPSAPHALAREAQRFLEAPLRRARTRVEEAEPIDEPRGDESRDDESVEAEDPAPSRQLSRTTYAWLIGGGAGVALGIGLNVKAWSLRDDVARAPVDTAADFNRLQLLEQRGRLYTGVGAVLAIGGAAAVVYGAVRAQRDRRHIDTAVSVVPTGNGASIVFAGTWR